MRRVCDFGNVWAYLNPWESLEGMDTTKRLHIMSLFGFLTSFWHLSGDRDISDISDISYKGKPSILKRTSDIFLTCQNFWHVRNWSEIIPKPGVSRVFRDFLALSKCFLVLTLTWLTHALTEKNAWKIDVQYAFESCQAIPHARVTHFFTDTTFNPSSRASWPLKIDPDSRSPYDETAVWLRT